MKVFNNDVDTDLLLHTFEKFPLSTLVTLDKRRNLSWNSPNNPLIPISHKSPSNQKTIKIIKTDVALLPTGN